MNSHTFAIFLAFLGTFIGIYIILIAPLIFNFWIIPKIENRYKGKIDLTVNNESYYGPFPNWSSRSLELSIYIFCKYIKFELPGVKDPWKGRVGYILKQKDYDIRIASRAEIVMSFLTVIFILLIIIIAIVFLIY